jgi:hypothetical protein
MLLVAFGEHRTHHMRLIRVVIAAGSLCHAKELGGVLGSLAATAFTVLLEFNEATRTQRKKKSPTPNPQNPKPTPNPGGHFIFTYILLFLPSLISQVLCTFVRLA